MGRTRALGFCALLWIGIWNAHVVFADQESAGKVPVALTYPSPKAKSVGVAGSFDPWWQKVYPMKRDAKGRWSVVLQLSPGRYEFHFLVDGKWRHDPRLPSIDDGLGGRNNVLVVFP